MEETHKGMENPPTLFPKQENSTPSETPISQVNGSMLLVNGKHYNLSGQEPSKLKAVSTTFQKTQLGGSVPQGLANIKQNIQQPSLVSPNVVVHQKAREIKQEQTFDKKNVKPPELNQNLKRQKLEETRQRESLKRSRNSDLEKAIKPDFKTPFSSSKDAIERLSAYHIFSEKEGKEENIDWKEQYSKLTHKYIDHLKKLETTFDNIYTKMGEKPFI